MAVTMTEEKGGYAEYAGLSTDNKPTQGVANGSIFLEMDTADVYAYDAANTTWRKLG